MPKLSKHLPKLYNCKMDLRPDAPDRRRTYSRGPARWDFYSGVISSACTLASLPNRPCRGLFSIDEAKGLSDRQLAKYMTSLKVIGTQMSCADTRAWQIHMCTHLHMHRHAACRCTHRRDMHRSTVRMRTHAMHGISPFGRALAIGVPVW